MDFLREFWRFLRVRKKYWLLPVLLMLAVFGGLIVLSQGSAVAPFIFTLFLAPSIRILGVSALFHDPAAARVVDGRMVAAAQEERFTRKKHDAGFPRHAMEYCLAEGETTLTDVDFVVFYDKPFIKFERLLETYMTFAPRG